MIRETRSSDGTLLVYDDTEAPKEIAHRQLMEKAEQALVMNADALALPDPTAGNTAYLGHAAIPAGTLTTAALSNAVRLLADQVDSLTRQNNSLVSQARAAARQRNALIRLALSLLDDINDT